MVGVCIQLPQDFCGLCQSYYMHSLSEQSSPDFDWSIQFYHCISDCLFLSCMKSLKFFAGCNRFSSGIILLLALFILPLTLRIVSVPPEGKPPLSMMLPPPRFAVEMCRVSFSHSGFHLCLTRTISSIHLPFPLHDLCMHMGLLVYFFQQQRSSTLFLKH